MNLAEDNSNLCAMLSFLSELQKARRLSKISEIW